MSTTTPAAGRATWNCQRRADGRPTCAWPAIAHRHEPFVDVILRPLTWSSGRLVRLHHAGRSACHGSRRRVTHARRSLALRWLPPRLLTHVRPGQPKHRSPGCCGPNQRQPAAGLPKGYENRVVVKSATPPCLGQQPSMGDQMPVAQAPTRRVLSAAISVMLKAGSVLQMPSAARDAWPGPSQTVPQAGTSAPPPG